ncbi:MAG: TRAP transporter substrate-binding protein DctP [Planctomycetes bacterium]|nr:TRAP transporter substrate-binding protein DctP [Planctomycetota bacterium]
MMRISRRLLTWAGAAAGVALAVAAATAPVAAAGSVKVRLGTLIPQGSSPYKHLQDMGDKWSKIPDAGLSLTIYPDGRMGDEAEMVRRIRAGQLQAGTLTVVGLSEIDPAVTGLQNLPMMFRSLDEVDYVGQKLGPMLEKRMLERGFVVLSWGDASWVRFFSKQPILVPDDLKKMKLFVWAGNTEQESLLKQSGFNPVPLAATDILPSLQTGLIDATPMVPFYALAAQVDSVAPHMLEINWAPLVGATVISKKTYDTIPESARPAFLEVATAAGKAIKADNRREAIESVEAMKKRGLQVHALTPETEKIWRDAAEAVWPKIRGPVVPADIYDEVVRLLDEFRKQGGAEKQ